MPGFAISLFDTYQTVIIVVVLEDDNPLHIRGFPVKLHADFSGVVCGLVGLN